jgi:putative transposase
MPKRIISFINGEIYHIVLRSVEGNFLFRDEPDHWRAIFGLYEFNNRKSVSIWQKRKSKKSNKMLQGRTLQRFRKEGRELLVDILAFCLMPNHIHLLLRQRKDGGITQFMRKLATGYAMYFNKKYNRTGHLFQGVFRAVHIENDSQFLAVVVYIHSNPVSIIFPKYKELGIDNVKKAMKFLENYKWSSYLDYIGKRNFPSVIRKDVLLKIIGKGDQIKEEISAWLEHKKDLKDSEVLGIE